MRTSTETALHVFIQWLASKDMLVEWMDVLIEMGYHENNNFRIGELEIRGGDTKYRFLSFTFVCPSWEYFHSSTDELLNLSDEWNRIIPNLSTILNKVEMYEYPYDR